MLFKADHKSRLSTLKSLPTIAHPTGWTILHIPYFHVPSSLKASLPISMVRCNMKDGIDKCCWSFVFFIANCNLLQWEREAFTHKRDTSKFTYVSTSAKSNVSYSKRKLRSGLRASVIFCDIFSHESPHTKSKRWHAARRAASANLLHTIDDDGNYSTTTINNKPPVRSANIG